MIRQLDETTLVGGQIAPEDVADLKRDLERGFAAAREAG